MPRAGQRARSSEAKEERAESILDAFEALLETQTFASINVAEVARRAGIAKGTVFIYFPTKEAMGLALVERHLGRWAAALNDALDRLSSPAASSELALVVVSTLEDRELLVRLLAILGSILEHNIDLDTARNFKLGLHHVLSPAAARLEAVLPYLGEGGGLRLLLLMNALVIGLHQMAGPAPVVQQVLASPGFAAFRIDFAPTLRGAIEAHLEGLRVLREHAMPGT